MNFATLSRLAPRLSSATALYLGPFGTPWHVCMHGLGLGQIPLQSTNAAALLDPLLHMSGTLLAHTAADPFQTLVHELLLLLAQHGCRRQATGEPSIPRLTQHTSRLLEGILDPEPRASALSLMLHVHTCLNAPLGDDFIFADLRAALHDLLVSQYHDARLHYHALSTAVQLLHAAQVSLQRHHSHTVELQLATHFHQTLRAIHQLHSAFDRNRLRALLLAVYGHGQWLGAQPAQWHSELKHLLAEAVDTSVPLPAADAIHTGLDFVTFPLSLALTAASSCTNTAHPAPLADAAAAALALLEQLAPASQASQFAFLVPALATLQISGVATLREHWAAIMRNYLRTSRQADADGYLRCTYLIFAAQTLGCAEAIPAAVYQRIEAALTTRPRPASGYFSWPMVISYAVYLQPLGHPATLANTAVLAHLLEHALPSGPVPRSEARKLSYALLHLALCISNARHPLHRATH